jgi:hypothetical protein
MRCVRVDSHAIPFPCRFRAVPLPCRSAKSLECVFPIWFTQCGRVWFTHTIPFPCHSPAMPWMCRSERDLSRPRQSLGRRTAWYMWISNGRPETACGPSARVRLLPATTRSSRRVVIRSIPISDAGGQCKTKQRLSWTSRSLLFWCKDMNACIIYSTKIMMAAMERQGTAWERYGYGMVCVNRPLGCRVTSTSRDQVTS